jgi:hypothetical protein
LSIVTASENARTVELRALRIPTTNAAAVEMEPARGPTLDDAAKTLATRLVADTTLIRRY